MALNIRVNEPCSYMQSDWRSSESRHLLINCRTKLLRNFTHLPVVPSKGMCGTNSNDQPDGCDGIGMTKTWSLQGNSNDQVSKAEIIPTLPSGARRVSGPNFLSVITG
jgi:hypothetical protein